jgi:hypothetical protein
MEGGTWQGTPVALLGRGREPTMKPTVSLVFALTALLSSAALADEFYVERSPSAGPNLLLFDPGDLINGILTVEYERAVNPVLGLTLGVSATTFRGAFTPDQDANIVAFGPEIGARIHLIQAAPAGLWIGPYLGLGYVATGPNGVVARAVSYGVGGAVGYNFVIARNFVFQLGAGGGFEDYGYGPVWEPRLRLGLGGVW